MLCLGPLNEPVDVLVCVKSVALLRALEKEGAPPGSILMVDVQPPEDPSVLFYQGDARDVLYKRPWRRAIVAPPCTHTANSGASSRPRKVALGLLLAAVTFCVWCFCAPAQAVVLEHSRSCLEHFWTPPDQVVSPHLFGDTFVHPRSGERCGMQKATELRVRGFCEPRLAIDSSLQATNPVSFANVAISSRHADGSPFSMAEVAEVRARYAPCFMAALARHVHPSRMVEAPRPDYDSALAGVLRAYSARYGADSLPRDWAFPEGRGPPGSAAARELSLALSKGSAGPASTYSARRVEATLPPLQYAAAPIRSTPLGVPSREPLTTPDTAPVLDTAPALNTASALVTAPRLRSEADVAARAAAPCGASLVHAQSLTAATAAPVSPRAPRIPATAASDAPRARPTVSTTALRTAHSALSAAAAAPGTSPHRKWIRPELPLASAALIGPRATTGAALPLLDLDGLAANSISYVVLVISTVGEARVAFPRRSAAAFGLDAAAGLAAAADRAESVALHVAELPCSVEAYMAGEIDAAGYEAGGAPALRIVIAPIPVGLSPAALECPVVQWLSLREVGHVVQYDIALASLERLRVQATPSRPVGVPLRIGRGATLSLSRDITRDAAERSFDDAVAWAAAGDVALRRALRRRARLHASADPAKSSFFLDCSERVLPVPVGELPHALRGEVRGFDVEQLLLEPYTYKAVVPISDSPGRAVAPPTSWPTGVAPPTCEREFYTTECFDAASTALERLAKWHADGGTSARPPPYGVGIDGVRPQFRDFILAGGIVDWTVDPPRPLDPANVGYKPRMRGDRAAVIFADSPDRRTTAAWTAVDAKPFDPVVVLRIVPNLLSVYADGCGGAAKALAAEVSGFAARGWARAAPLARSRAHGRLGLPNSPFGNQPNGLVPKQVGWRVVLECGHPRTDWFLPTGERVFSANEWHGPSKPAPGTALRLAGDAPAARELKPDVREGIHNSAIIGHGAHLAGLHVHELGLDFFKAFHRVWPHEKAKEPLNGRE